ncbi:MAG: sigma-70 family RNA polymerase sigma factor [Bryobacteraceae bacterium]|nr:sigma-70 family RNA polymerase sigma factor [Bryobacteraceae bacterium]
METPNQNHRPATPDRDHELMRRVAAGDLAAFSELVLRNQKSAWAVAWRILRDSAEAEDVTQEAFLRVFRAVSRYRPIAPFRTYLLQIVTRLCLDVRAKKRPDYLDELPEIAQEFSTPEEALERRERALPVRRAIARLSPRHRAAIALRHEENLSYEEIARVLHVSPKAVDSLLQRARQSLRKLLPGVTEA